MPLLSSYFSVSWWSASGLVLILSKRWPEISCLIYTRTLDSRWAMEIFSWTCLMCFLVITGKILDFLVNTNQPQYETSCLILCSSSLCCQNSSDHRSRHGEEPLAESGTRAKSSVGCEVWPSWFVLIWKKNKNSQIGISGISSSASSSWSFYESQSGAVLWFSRVPCRARQ